MADRFNITEHDRWFIGTDVLLPFTIYQKDESVSPRVIQPITGYSLEFFLRDPDVQGSSRTVRIRKTSDTVLPAPGGIVITDGPAGLCEVTIEDTDTSVLSPGTYYYELRRVGAGAEHVLTFGTVVLLRGR